MNIANLDKVIYNKRLYIDCKGIKRNWSGGINIPATVERRGIRNNWVEIGIFWASIWPFCIWHCGTVGERKVYLVPRQN